MQPHEKQDQEPDSPKRKKPDPRDTQAKWLLFAIAILLGLITAQIIKRLVENSHAKAAIAVTMPATMGGPRNIQ